MKRDAYIAAILRRTGLDGKTKRRIRADLETDIDARLDAGESIEAVEQAMGGPKEVAESLMLSMAGGTAARKSPWRWVLLAATVACVLLIGFCIGGEVWISELEPFIHLLFGERFAVSADGTATSVGTIDGADGPTAIFVTSMIGGYSRQIPFLLGLAAAALGGFLLLQWRGSSGRVRFLVLGVALGAAGTALAIAGIGMWVSRGLAGGVLGWLFVLAALAQLAVGAVALRRYALSRRRSKAG